MTAWRSLLLASLFDSAQLGVDAVSELGTTAGIEAMAAVFPDADALAAALDVRVGSLALRPDSTLATETLAVLAPLAERRGLGDRRASLEEASFRVLEPVRYAELQAVEPMAAALLERLADDTRGLLADHGIDGVVTGRVKSAYSTWRKMAKKGRDADGIFDRVALRVVVSTIGECDDVLALIHGRHVAIPGELDDYIRAPKANGYRSLHTAVYAAGRPNAAEFQVRTREMHAAAERGGAAHWLYKLETPTA